MVVVPVDVEKEDVRILKVCFYSNSFNPGKNFKLVKCTVQTEIQVRVADSVPQLLCSSFHFLYRWATFLEPSNF